MSSLIFYKDKIKDNSDRYWIKRKRTNEIIGIEDSSWHREFFPFTTIWKFDDSLGSGGDFTTGIKKARDSMETTGGVIFLPTGTYLGTECITIDTPGVNIMGAGWGTTINRASDYGDTFLFTGNDASGTLLLNCGISNLAIQSSAATTNGAHIHFNGVRKFILDRIYLQHGFVGIQSDGVVASYFSKIYLVNTNPHGGDKTGRRYISFGNASGEYSHKPSGDLFITDFNIRGNTTDQSLVEYGIEVTGSDGIWFENGHIGNASDANILVNGSSTEMLNLLYFTNVMCDEGVGHGVYFDGSSASTYSDIKFSNCTFKGGGHATYGVGCSASCDATYVTFDNCSVTEYKYHGVNIPNSASSFRGILFNNCTVHGNAWDTGASSSGYYLGSNCQDITINAGCSGRHNTVATQGLQEYGIRFGGATTNVRVIGVDLTGNVTASFFGGSDAYVHNCLTKSIGSPAPSAATLTTRVGEDYMVISGTTNITSIVAAYKGKRVTLIFQDVLTVTDGGNIKLNGNFVTSADDTLTLICDGTNWIEVSRSAN
jgi:hypothetical protein